MKVAYSSAISRAFAVTDSHSSHEVVFTAYQFGVLFVAISALSLFLVKAYNKRSSRVKQTKSQCLQAIEGRLNQRINAKNPPCTKKQEVKEIRPRLSKKAKKRLRAAANDKKAPLPVTSLTLQPDRDGIMKAIEDVSSRHVFVECKEKKATAVKKVRKVRDVAVCNVSAPVAPAVATKLPAVVKTAVSSKAAVVTKNDQPMKSRRPRRRPFTLHDYILRSNMHLEGYVQTYRV